jgi:uncharacterized SAM-binding protein YcdF (DUF218 family)
VKVLDRRRTDDFDDEDGYAPVSRPRRRGRTGPVRWIALFVKATLLMVALGALYLGVTLAQVWDASGDDDQQKAGAIVVLGAAQYNGRPSPALQARLEHALELYEAGVAPVIVLTGGRQSGDRYTEATSGYNWLRDRDVPDENLRKEVNGTSTWESLSATARFLKDEDIDEVVLVSEPSHAYRVQGIAEEVGLVAHVSPAESSGGASVRALVRETLAVSVGRIIGYGRLGRLDSVT